MVSPRSTPPYPRIHVGPCIILGSAASALADLSAALKVFPRASVAAVNFMYRWAPFATHVCAADVGFFGMPEVADAMTFANRHAGCARSYPHDQAPGRPFLWRGIKEGSSGMFAGRVMRAIGFAPVVLAGVRIDDSGHLPGYRPGLHDPAFPRSAETIGSLRETWRDAHVAGHLEGITSMSGWTRELLGAPSP